MIYTSHQILVTDQTKKNETGRAHGTYGREEKCTQGFGGET
jgi:hypothetical protein